MTMHEEFLLLMAGVLSILIVASIVGAILHHRLNADRTNDTVENLNARIVAWWAMVVLLGLAFLAGPTGVLVLFAILSFTALREFLTLTVKRR